ncbi:MAG TPA: hypothetical protein VFC02_06385 [Anaerolineales bacterium]|nr:hypothetical protein [Anaerolineales bacterium]
MNCQLYDWVISALTLLAVAIHVILYVLKKNDIPIPVINKTTNHKKDSISAIHNILTQLADDIKSLTDSSRSNTV